MEKEKLEKDEDRNTDESAQPEHDENAESWSRSAGDEAHYYLWHQLSPTET